MNHREKMNKENIDAKFLKGVNEERDLCSNEPKSIKNYLIDIDGTVCDDVLDEEDEIMSGVEAYPTAVENINDWYNNGHIITFFTSRLEAHRELTEKWLENSGFKYHSLIMDKPRGGNYHWIDSHKVDYTRYKSKFTKMLKRGLTLKF